jgi:hypothetical protein
VLFGDGNKDFIGERFCVVALLMLAAVSRSTLEIRAVSSFEFDPARL